MWSVVASGSQPAPNHRRTMRCRASIAAPSFAAKSTVRWASQRACIETAGLVEHAACTSRSRVTRPVSRVSSSKWWWYRVLSGLRHRHP